MVRELGQPTLLIEVDREKIARYGINVSDVEAVIQAAVGGQAATQVIQGEKLFDLVVRMQPQFRSSAAGDRQFAGRRSGRGADSTFSTGDIQTEQRRVVSSTAKTIPATSACNTALKAATWRARCSEGKPPSIR